METNLDKKIISWIQQNYKKMDITIKQLTWTDDWAPELSEYSTCINFEGIAVFGRGNVEDHYALQHFNNLLAHDHRDHMKLGLNIEYTDELLRRILPKENINFENDLSAKQIKIVTQQLFLKNKLFENCPFVFYRAKSNDLQNLITGPFQYEKINWKRFKQTKLVQNFSVKDLLPHPLA